MNKVAFIETAKEALRWVLLFGVSWVITQTLTQVDVIPESQNVTVWLFTYTIPVRMLVNLFLTAAGRLVDKYLYEMGKDTGKTITLLGQEISFSKGLTRF